MSTPKQTAANRRNAEKSTEPRTARSKARTRLIASKQGLSANVLVLPGEDAEQYRSRLKAWTGHLAPTGPVELYLVQRAVQISWQLDRADRCQVARLSHPGLPEASEPATAETAVGADRLAFDDSDAGERLRNHQLACGRMLIRTLDAFATLRLAFAEARGDADGHDVTGPREQADGEATSRTANDAAAAAERQVEEAASANEPANPHSLIEEILAGIQARPSHAEPASTHGAPIGRDVRAAVHSAESNRNGIGSAAGGTSPRVDRIPSADRADVRIGQRSSQFPRVANREASLSGWTGHREMEERQANVPHSRNVPVRRSTECSEAGPNEPALRRRVGGYEVPLDPWVPVTGADRTPVRLRRREARDVSGPSTGCMPA
jgi:hypothetical protein